MQNLIDKLSVSFSIVWIIFYRNGIVNTQTTSLPNCSRLTILQSRYSFFRMGNTYPRLQERIEFDRIATWYIAVCLTTWTDFSDDAFGVACRKVHKQKCDEVFGLYSSSNVVVARIGKFVHAVVWVTLVFWNVCKPHKYFNQHAVD